MSEPKLCELAQLVSDILGALYDIAIEVVIEDAVIGEHEYKRSPTTELCFGVLLGGLLQPSLNF